LGRKTVALLDAREAADIPADPFIVVVGSYRVSDRPLASILSKVTLSASVEALGQLTQGVKAMISIAVLAGSIATTGGAAAGGASMGGASYGSEAGLGDSEAILEHYNQAEALTQQARAFSNLGLRAPAQHARTQAHGHELAACRLGLGKRLTRFS
jgi:hypothetical protein